MEDLGVPGGEQVLTVVSLLSCNLGMTLNHGENIHILMRRTKKQQRGICSDYSGHACEISWMCLQ